MGSAYRLEWSRPLVTHLPGERAYHATNGVRHILVIVSDDQIRAADRLAEVMRAEDPEISVQDVIEEAISHAVATRPPVTGELRLEDDDFA